MDDYFEEWVGTCDKLVADFEGFLRSPEALEAYERVGVSLVDDYPAVSQDFNAIENAWKLLRDRLNDTLPKNLVFNHLFRDRYILPHPHASLSPS